MKKIENEHLIDPFTDEPAIMNVMDTSGKQIESTPMTIAVVVRMIVSSFRAGGNDKLPAMTMDDSYHGIRVLEKLRPFKKIEDYTSGKMPKYIELEDDDFKWLLKVTKERAVLIFNVVAKIIVDALERVEKSDEAKK